MSTLVPLLHPRPLPNTATTIAKALYSMPECVPPPSNDHRYVHKYNRPHPGDTQGRRLAATTVEDIFVRALVAAGSCSKHKERRRLGAFATRRPSIVATRAQFERTMTQKCQFSSKQSKDQIVFAVAAAPEPDVSREEYKQLVQTYPSFDGPNPKYKRKQEEKRKQHQPLASRLVLTPQQELLPPYAPREVLPPVDSRHELQLKIFRGLLKNKPGRVGHLRLWQAWEAMQSPRPRYLEDEYCKRFFRHLSRVQFREEEGAMQRYFTLLDECVGEHVELPEWIWNSAIVFAGRWLRHITGKEVKAAIETWMRMEEHGHQASHVTYNILFQISVRAGRYALADTIFNELKQREMPLDRYFRTNLIHYAGVRRDGEGVRQAFRDLVNAGQIVDTSVMNSVIMGLFRAGEPTAAEQVFLRMQSLHEQKFGTRAPEDWRNRNNLFRVLQSSSERLLKEKMAHEASFFGASFSSEDKREEIQKASPVAPDALTYRIFIKYHVYTSGNVFAARKFLDEMREQGMPIHGSVYVHLLRGFYLHGGYAYSDWSRKRLEELWLEILTLLARPVPVRNEWSHTPSDDEPISQEDHSDESDMLGAMMAEYERSTGEAREESNEIPDPMAGDFVDAELGVPELLRPAYLTAGFARAAVHAFYRCTGRKRMLEVWSEIQGQWIDASREDVMRVQRDVDQMVAEDSMYDV